MKTEETLQLTVPPISKKSLKMLAAESGDYMRVIMLRSLATARVNAPDGELHDRRKAK